MGKTRIEWATDVWNPVTGCTRVSSGCDHCYMFRQWPRLHAMGVRGYEGSPDVPVLHPERLGEPARWKKPRHIFVCSMSDLFHSSVPFEFIMKVFCVMESCPRHTFQVLTKRPGRMAYFANTLWCHESRSWPSNVWAGTSLEAMQDGNRFLAGRLQLLSEVPATVRFVSAEPLLGWLNLQPWLDGTLHWVIAGCESGPGARPMHPDWVRSLRNQCQTAGVPFFYKQAIIDGRKVGCPELDGKQYREMPHA